MLRHPFTVSAAPFRAWGLVGYAQAFDNIWIQFYPYRNNKVSVWHMARLPITETECSRILSLPKGITDDIVWSKKANKSWASSKVPVDSELRGKLEIIITVNMDEPSKFSITLLLNSTHRIRGLDMRGSH